jgi:thiamine kinase-like enzyme
MDGQLICVDQSPVSFAWYLYFNYKSLQLHTFRNRYRIIKKIKKLWLLRRSTARHNDTTLLPVYGNLALKVHRGYKVFDFKKQVVTKLFSTDTPEEAVHNEIKAVQEAGKLDFAPTIRRIDLNERWYEEDFIVGSPFLSQVEGVTQKKLKDINQSLIQCLYSTMTSCPPRQIDLYSYANNIKQNVLKRCREDATMPRETHAEIETFVTTMTGNICLAKSVSLNLLFSHGDFSLVNLLNTRNGISVIDWEGAELRNPFCDLFNLYCTEAYYERIQLESMIPQLGDAMEDLKRLMHADDTRLLNSLPGGLRLYGWLYYLERVEVLVEREFSKNLDRVILKSINLFKQMDKTIARKMETI